MLSRLGLAVTLAASLTATGCAAFEQPADDGVTRIAAGFYPLAWVAERVTAGTTGTVVLLTRPGTEPHDLEIGIQATAEVARADLLLYESGFQPAVDDTIDQNAEGTALDAAKVLPLRASTTPGDHGHDHGTAANEHGQDRDPHFWQDPELMAEYGDAVADELGTIDPANASTYAQNAADLRDDLNAVDAQYRQGLAECKRHTIVVSHDAFSYLEKYGLHVNSIVGLSPDAEPTGAVLGQLQSLIRREGVTTVFGEPLEAAIGQTMADDLGLRTATLDPIESLSDANSSHDYLSLMRTNLTALRTANGCP